MLICRVPNVKYLSRYWRVHYSYNGVNKIFCVRKGSSLFSIPKNGDWFTAERSINKARKDNSYLRTLTNTNNIKGSYNVIFERMMFGEIVQTDFGEHFCGTILKTSGYLCRNNFINIFLLS